MPMDQHLTLNGVPLSNNDATLITLGIKPGSLLLLQVCLKLSRGGALPPRRPVPFDAPEQSWRMTVCRQS